MKRYYKWRFNLWHIVALPQQKALNRFLFVSRSVTGSQRAGLAAGVLDAIIDDSPIAAYFAQAMPGLALAGALPNTEASYAIMVQSGNRALRDTINAAL